MLSQLLLGENGWGLEDDPNDQFLFAGSVPNSEVNPVG